MPKLEDFGSAVSVDLELLALEDLRSEENVDLESSGLEDLSSERNVYLESLGSDATTMGDLAEEKWTEVLRSHGLKVRWALYLQHPHLGKDDEFEDVTATHSFRYKLWKSARRCVDKSDNVIPDALAMFKKDLAAIVQTDLSRDDLRYLRRLCDWRQGRAPRFQENLVEVDLLVDGMDQGRKPRAYLPLFPLKGSVATNTSLVKLRDSGALQFALVEVKHKSAHVLTDHDINQLSKLKALAKFLGRMYLFFFNGAKPEQEYFDEDNKYWYMRNRLINWNQLCAEGDLRQEHRLREKAERMLREERRRREEAEQVSRELRARLAELERGHDSGSRPAVVDSHPTFCGAFSVDYPLNPELDVDFAPHYHDALAKSDSFDDSS